MALLEIIHVPHPSLKAKAQEVQKIDETIIRQTKDMLETMYKSHGIGLAANQVNILNRIFVMDINEEKKEPIAMINPEIIWQSEEKSSMDEGCLSIPEQTALVERPASVKVKYLTTDGTEQVYDASGLASHCVQHEIDHLNGVLCIDYLSRLKRNMAIRRVEKLVKSHSYPF